MHLLRFKMVEGIKYSSGVWMLSPSGPIQQIVGIFKTEE